MALPVPFYQDALVTLYNGDARDILPQLPSASMGVAIIDPPDRDGDLSRLNTLMAQVRPDLARICAHVIEMTHMEGVFGNGQQRNDLVASNCTFMIDGVVQAPSRIADPDMKVAGWGTIFGISPGATLDCFSGGGGWILLAAKRAGRTAIGIELNSFSCAQSAARLAAG